MAVDIFEWLAARIAHAAVNLHGAVGSFVPDVRANNAQSVATAMIKEANAVVLLLERFDLLRDESVQLTR